MTTKYNGIIVEKTSSREVINFYTDKKEYCEKNESLFMEASGRDWVSKWAETPRVKSRLFKLSKIAEENN